MPDAPINLAEDLAQRSATSIHLTWSEGAHNGGLSVIDYRINQRIQGGSYSVVATGVTPTSYTALSLALGTTYEWTIEARNSDGYSLESLSITILHANAPD